MLLMSTDVFIYNTMSYIIKYEFKVYNLVAWESDPQEMWQRVYFEIIITYHFLGCILSLRLGAQGLILLVYQNFIA